MSDKLREAFERIYPRPLPAHPNDNLFNQIRWEGFQAGYAYAMRGEKVYSVESDEVIHGFYRDKREALLARLEDSRLKILIYARLLEDQ